MLKIHTYGGDEPSRASFFFENAVSMRPRRTLESDVQEDDSRYSLCLEIYTTCMHHIENHVKSANKTWRTRILRYFYIVVGWNLD